MRFLADMGVSLRVVEWLQLQGHDATHLRGQGLQRLPDLAIFRKAVAERRILLTFDLGFGEIAALSADESAGVILFRLHNTRTPHVLDRLRAVLATFSADLEREAVVLVEETRVRVRQLPLRGERPAGPD